VKKVVGIDSGYDDHTMYAQAFRNSIVYSLPIFDPNHSGYTYDLIRCLDQNATAVDVARALKDPDVVFITGSGHGTFELFKGDNGTVIWDRKTLQSAQVRDRIVHLLACEAGGVLGSECIIQGAAAFWGYSDKFRYVPDPTQPTPVAADTRAAPFFKLDALIDEGILYGKTADTIYTDVQSAFWGMWAQLQNTRPHASDAGDLMNNFVHLVGPIWGNTTATL
jgi:hypothetical protein